MRSIAAAACVLAVVVGACTTRRATQIVVEIDAQSGVIVDLDVVHVVVTVVMARALALRVSSASMFANGLLGGPFTVVIAPLDRDPQRRYEVVVSAEGAVPSGGAERPVIATVRALSGFVPGETRVLRLVLEDACRGVRCGAEETCRAGTCRPADVDPITLPMPGVEVDAGTVIADAASIDAFHSHDTAQELDAIAENDTATNDAPLTNDVGALVDADVESPIVQIAASSTASGGGHFCALRADGSVWCWGRNDQGQLGDGTHVARSRPVRVMDLPAVEEVALGGRHSCGRTAEGLVYCWGSNGSRQLGTAAVGSPGVVRPVLVERVLGATRIGCGYEFSCAVLLDGTVSCWATARAARWVWGVVASCPRSASTASPTSARSASATSTAALSQRAGTSTAGAAARSVMEATTTTPSPVRSPVCRA